MMIITINLIKVSYGVNKISQTHIVTGYIVYSKKSYVEVLLPVP